MYNIPKRHQRNVANMLKEYTTKSQEVIMIAFNFEIEPFGRAFVENRRKSMEERIGAA